MAIQDADDEDEEVFCLKKKRDKKLLKLTF
jgi:hypothetical protein